jgi:hypothetical protein
MGETLPLARVNDDKQNQNYFVTIFQNNNIHVGGGRALLDTGTNVQGFFHVKHIIEIF